MQRLAACVGMTTAAKQAVRMSPLYHRQLQARVFPLATSLEEVKQSYHQMVELSQEAREEPAWWTNKVQRFKSAPLLTKTPDMVIELVYCLGWMAILKSQQVRTGGLWSTEKQKLHIECLELTTVLMTVISFAKDRIEHQHSSKDGQNISQSIHQSPGWSTLPSTEYGGNRAVEVVHQQEHLLDSRASPRHEEPSCR